MKSEKYRGRRIYFRENYFRGKRIVNAYLNGESIGVGVNKEHAFNDAKNKIDMYYIKDIKAIFDDDEETAYELLGETWGYLAIYDEDEPTEEQVILSGSECVQDHKMQHGENTYSYEKIEHIDFDSRTGYTETGRNFVF